MLAKLNMLLRGGLVRRYHTIPTLTSETVAQHSFYVAWLVTLLSPTQTPSAALLLAALQHDLAEYQTGDLPSPSKRALGIREQFATYETQIVLREWGRDYTTELTDAEKRTLSMADSMAGLLHCTYERTLGNIFVDEAYNNYRKYVGSMNPEGREMEIFQTLITEWSNAISK